MAVLRDRAAGTKPGTAPGDERRETRPASDSGQVKGSTEKTDNLFGTFRDIDFDCVFRFLERRELGREKRRVEKMVVPMSEPLAALEQFLVSRGQPVRMRPVVLLNHPKARISSCAPDVGVEVLIATAQLRDLVTSSEEQIAARKLTEIERLIVRDHHFHEERRQASKAKPATEET